jgi:pyruvate dehydrogenase E1 component alpha subunit
MQTYRYRGHSMSDPAKYRTKEEVQKIRAEQDPLDTLKNVLIERGDASEDDLKAYDREVREAVNEAADFAQASPEPDPAELYTNVLRDA